LGRDPARHHAPQRTAAAYTLTHFLLQGDGGSQREKFFDYLRGAWLGKIQAKAFVEAMGMKEDELVARWSQYVESVAR